MTDFLQRLKQRKLVQWALAYVAGAWVVLQVLSLAAGSYHWPDAVMHIAFGVLALGFVVTLVLAWYHGERGVQRINGVELLIIALVLAVGGGVLWNFARAPSTATASSAIASTSGPDATRSPDAAQRNPGTGRPTLPQSAAGAAASGLRVASVPVMAQPIPAKSIAVLPFENLSNDKANAYFVAGMQGMILAKLGDVRDLKVIARSATADYSSHPGDTLSIGRQLGVATLLEGSVQKAGNEVLIEVRLMNAGSDSQIWAGTYQRTLSNVFGVEGEVANKIAAALNAKLSPMQSAQLAAAPTTNQAAYDLFLRAEYQANRGDSTTDVTTLKAAIALYRQAIAQDPGFALAYARLSQVQSRLARIGGGGESVQQLFRQARADAEQALKLAPNQPASQLALGYSEYYGNDDFAAALKAFDAALALRPNDADALFARGLIQRRLGQFDAALASFTEAFAHNPRSSVLAEFVAFANLDLSRYPETEIWSQRALALDPDNRDARGLDSRAIMLRTGDVARALAALQGDAPQLKRHRVQLLVFQRKYVDAIVLLESIPDTPENFLPNRPSKALRLARIYRLAGDAAKARPLYAQALLQARAQVPRIQGVHLVFVWHWIAEAELGLGHTAEAFSAIAKARALGAESGDHAFGPGWMEESASLYAEAGRADLAVPILAKALVTPGIGAAYSPVLLWLDRDWDPIRNDPRFQALLRKYAKYKPAVIYGDARAASGTGHG